MAEKLLMVALSPTMEVGTIAKWHVAEGQEVRSGMVLCEVETDKATMEYESGVEGTLLKIVVPEGGKAAVGDVIGIVGAVGEDISGLVTEVAGATGGAKAAEVAAKVEERHAEVAAAVPGVEMRENVGGQREIRSSPLARKLAAEYGINLAEIRGSGPGGRIVKADVEAARAARKEVGRVGQIGPITVSAEDRVIPVSQKRRIIAQRLSESMYSAPHYYLKVRVEVDEILRAREAYNKNAERPCSLNAILMYFVAQALKKHPMVHAAWEGERIRLYGRADIGLAVAVEDGLLTPIVRDCGRKSISEIDEELRGLIERARSGKLLPEEFTGATFTISNLGSFGIEEFTAIINPPGSAILAVGEARKEQVVEEGGGTRVATVMRLTLSCDHRVIDGAVGAAFLRDLKSMMEHPLLVMF